MYLYDPWTTQRIVYETKALLKHWIISTHDTIYGLGILWFLIRITVFQMFHLDLLQNPRPRRATKHSFFIYKLDRLGSTIISCVTSWFGWGRTIWSFKSEYLHGWSSGWSCYKLRFIIFNFIISVMCQRVELLVKLTSSFVEI